MIFNKPPTMRPNTNPLFCPFVIIFHREADIRAMLYNELCKEYPEFYNTIFGYKTRRVGSVAYMVVSFWLLQFGW